MRKERRMHSKRKGPFLKRLFPDSVMLRCVFCVSVFLCIVVLGIQSYHFAQLKMQEHEIQQDMDRLTDEKEELEQKKQDLVRMVYEDAEAFEPLAKAYRMPKETEEEQAEKEKVMEAALENAAEAPLCIMKTIVDTMEMIRVLGEKGSRLAVSDAGVAILFAQAALEGASLNIFINTKMMKDQEEAERLNYLADQLIATGKELKETTYDAVLKGIRP